MCETSWVTLSQLLSLSPSKKARAYHSQKCCLGFVCEPPSLAPPQKPRHILAQIRHLSIPWGALGICSPVFCLKQSLNSKQICTVQWLNKWHLALPQFKNFYKIVHDTEHWKGKIWRGFWYMPIKIPWWEGCGRKAIGSTHWIYVTQTNPLGWPVSLW